LYTMKPSRATSKVNVKLVFQIVSVFIIRDSCGVYDP
jgi:hypothetical protein